MSTGPQPPCPSVAPQSPGSGTNVVAISLSILALIVLASGIAIWTGLQFFSHGLRVQVEDRQGLDKGVSVKTPFGSVEVHHAVDEDSLSLPLYPGAMRVKDKDSAAINVGFGGVEGAQVLVAKFKTPDPMERVKAFYKERLGSDVTKLTDEGWDGKTTFEIRTHNLVKIVALEGAGSGTLIKLVRVSAGNSESN